MYFKQQNFKEINININLISSDEYVTLLLIAKNLYPNGAAYPVKDVLEKAGIEIE